VLRAFISGEDGVARVTLRTVAIQLALVELGVAADVAHGVVAEADVEPRAEVVGVEVQVTGCGRIVDAIVEVGAADVAGALVAEVLVGQEPADVVGRLEHRAQPERAQVDRAVLAVGLELVAWREVGPPVLLLGRAGRAQRPGVRDRNVDHAAEAEQRVAARDDLTRGVESARVRLRRVQRDGAARRVTTEQRALRPAQDLDPVEVVHHHRRALRAGRKHSVGVKRDALVAGFGLVTRAEPADEDQGHRMVAVLEELQIRDQAADVEQRHDAVVVQRLLVEGADRKRRLLQIGLAPGGGDDDLLQRDL